MKILKRFITKKKLTKEDILAVLQTELQKIEPHIQSDEISAIRYKSIFAAIEYLELFGFPEALMDKYAISLVPKYFQETMYDGYNWFEQKSEMGPLTGIFNMDFAIQTGGLQRHTASKGEFKQYYDFTNQAIIINQRPTDEFMDNIDNLMLKMPKMQALVFGGGA